MSQDRDSDVRMRGFANRVTVEHALAWLDAELEARIGTGPGVHSEMVPLDRAADRVLAEDHVAGMDVPSFTRAMMDGFAVRASDIQGASSYNHLRLVEVGVSMPGCGFAGQTGPGQAVRIMTGAPLPEGADAVLPAELVDWGVDGKSPRAIGEVSVGKHIGQPGEDISRGQTVFPSGRRLRPQDIGVLSSLGVAEVQVICPPRVRIVITGNELLAAGSPPTGYQITDANGPMLAALVARDRGLAHNPGIVPDEREAIRKALTDEADVILISGGSSVGEEDHAPGLVAEMGELPIHGIAMRPSSPTGIGTIGHKLIFLLPGNPVSCLCAYDFYAARAIRALGRLGREFPYRTVRLPLRRKLVSMVGRVDYARVEIVDGQVEPLAISGASMLSTTTRADGFVVAPSNSEGYPAAAEVDVFLYDAEIVGL